MGIVPTDPSAFLEKDNVQQDALALKVVNYNNMPFFYLFNISPQ